MTQHKDSFAQHVTYLESSLAPYAKHSFEAYSPAFVDGGELYAYYSKQWEDPIRSMRIVKRTPLQLERDRIVHAPITRKLTEKYQVLYSGQRKVVRNYATHVNRLVQVTRAMCRWLDLNSDFAEAIALGSKTGALPFVHASKDAVATWVRKKVAEVDRDFAQYDPRADPEPMRQLSLSFGPAEVPSWISSLRSPRVLEKVLRFIPWAAGRGLDPAYSTGQQGYWMLASNPFTLESRPNTYSPETMYGVWRHTLGAPIGRDSFLHRMKIARASNGSHEISWCHATYEGLAVSCADDITWAIENLNDANTAALLNGKRSVYESVLAEVGKDVPDALMSALAQGDPGMLYTYFIADVNASAERTFQTLGEGAKDRSALRTGAADAGIGLSADGLEHLNKLKAFLDRHVFAELRVANRTKMLRTLSEACMELLYRGTEDILPRYLRDKASLERWPDDKRQQAMSLLKDDVHRIQLVVNVFCEMGDQEIYDLVGIESL